MEKPEPNILIIDDRLSDIELTLLALKDAGYDAKTYVVRDGEEALDYLFARGQYENRKEKAPPKLILLDLNLPKISGLDVLRQIKSDERTKNIPVIILTVSEESEDVRECFAIGANNYVLKSSDFAIYTLSLLERVQYWFDQQKNRV